MVETLRPLAVALLLIAFAGCGAPEAAPPAPPEVTVDQPVRREVTLFQEFTGQTRASASVEVDARVSGTLEQMLFEPSLMVEQGQLLFVIEPRSYKAALDAAEAALRSAKAQLARAESDLKRVTQAAKTNAVSEADVDLAQANRDMAEAAVYTAEAGLDQAQLTYSYTQVTAPIAGQVGRNLVDVGNVVSGSQRTVLTTINQLAPIHGYFNVPEQALLNILRVRSLEGVDIEQDGVDVEMATLVDEGYPHKGEFDFISNTVDSATGTIEVRAVFANEDEKLFPGLFVRLRVPVGTVEDAILVDERAVGSDLGGRYVYVIGPDNVVEQRYVTLGPVEDDGMVPVSEGLEGSETYITEGLLRARPGMPVTPQQGTD
jgi:RND family efflux transporter MFP subunit